MCMRIAHHQQQLYFAISPASSRPASSESTPRLSPMATPNASSTRSSNACSAPVLAAVRVRNDPYKCNVHRPAMPRDGYVIERRSLPPIEVLSPLELTPLPSMHLFRCSKYTYRQLASLGQEHMAYAQHLRAVSQTQRGVGSAALFIGQMGYGMQPVEVLGLLRILLPKVETTMPEAHSHGRGQASGSRKGSAHVRVHNGDASVQAMLRLNGSCYHDTDGVYVATDDAGRAQLALFEDLMEIYANGVGTSRPKGLMTVVLARKQTLGN